MSSCGRDLLDKRSWSGNNGTKSRDQSWLNATNPDGITLFLNTSSHFGRELRIRFNCHTYKRFILCLLIWNTKNRTYANLNDILNYVREKFIFIFLIYININIRVIFHYFAMKIGTGKIYKRRNSKLYPYTQVILIL